MLLPSFPTNVWPPNLARPFSVKMLLASLLPTSLSWLSSNRKKSDIRVLIASLILNEGHSVCSVL